MEPGRYTVAQADRAARAAMVQYWGEVPAGKNWETKTTEGFIEVEAAWYDNGLSVMDVVERVVATLRQ